MPALLPVAADTPAAARLAPPPPKGRYRLLALLDAPRRMLHPGSMVAPSPAQPDKFGGATAGVVRGFERTKLADVKLDDVIAGKHTPPLTLRDFEDFLAFKKKASENLYFELWLRSYEELYAAASPPAIPSTSQSLELAASYRLCLAAFFSSSSPLELNTSADIRRELDAAVRSVGNEKSDMNVLPPSAFAKVRDDSNAMLAQSFRAFLLNQSRNADRNRAYFAQILGLATWALGLIPTIVCTQVGASRGWRALGLFFWWFGIVVFVGGYRRTCLVIYLFGDSRQLYSWELAALAASNPDSASGVSEWSAPTSHNRSTKDELEQPTSPSSSVTYFHVPPSPSLSSKRSKSASTTAGLYFAPAHVLPTLPASAPVWAPFTKVLSPIVCRAQRDTVLAAAGIALVAMVVTAAICLSVPNRR